VQLTVLFARQALAADRPADAQGPDHRELLRYMYLHCGQKLTLQQLADVFGCSRSTVSARITAMTGLSFFDLLNEMRIGKTADYLLYTDLTLKELAEILGYVDESHISKVFAARLGTRIGQYRATYQKVQNICQIEESRLGHSLVQHIYRHYREDLSAAGVARAFGISVQQLNRTLLCQVELNFEDFLALIRVNRACKLLTTTRMTVLDIALEVGYRNAKTLNRNFLKYRLMTPSAYRAAHSGQ
jgi:AraC-like DNA-binding protein